MKSTKHFEQLIKSEEIYKGRVIRVTLDTVLLENGEEATRDVVHHFGGAAVAAIDSDDSLIMVRQYRHPLQCEMLELPAGKLEQGEDPFAAAKRELSEEAGVIASDYVDLGYIIPTCGFCNEKIYIYGAKNLTSTAIHLDEDEFVSVIKIPFEQAVDMCVTSQITDSKTLAAILKLNQLRISGKF